MTTCTNRFVYLRKLNDSRFETVAAPLISSKFLVDQSLSSYQFINEGLKSIKVLYPNGAEEFSLATTKKSIYSPLEDLVTTCEFIALECTRSTRLGSNDSG